MNSWAIIAQRIWKKKKLFYIYRPLEMSCLCQCCVGILFYILTEFYDVPNDA